MQEATKSAVLETLDHASLGHIHIKKAKPSETILTKKMVAIYISLNLIRIT